MKQLDFVFFDAGGGHRAAATALRRMIRAQRRPFAVRMLNLQELLDSIDIFRRLTGIRMQDLYNLMLKKGWTLGSPQMTVGMHAVIRLFHGRQVRLLNDLWQSSRPDMVVSLVPNFNRAIAESLDRTLPGVRFVTILTDLADYPPHFWIEKPRPGHEQYVICGTDRALEQALALEHQRTNLFRVSGMVLNPNFYEIAPLTPEARSAERAKLGFEPDVPVGLMLFGGHGTTQMYDIAQRLRGRQLLMICGHNAKLASKLKGYAASHGAPVFVEGFTKEIPRYMQLADYFIGKPGPGSITEAVHMGLPVIVERNAWTLPQERYNADWLLEQGVGIVLENFHGIAQAVDSLLDPAAYAAYRAATERLENRAVFEIPEILEKLLATD
ncbi:MAG: galactosyldiacylglycerol synthase [Acidobacteriia bacterium]|nr:galactosyldiacylglycerol synthase [Terriglobia bacterium]